MKRFLLALVLAFALSAPAGAGWDEGAAAYVRGDYQTAYREFLQLAEQGFAEAQTILGAMYYEGQGVGLTNEIKPTGLSSSTSAVADTWSAPLIACIAWRSSAKALVEIHASSSP